MVGISTRFPVACLGSISTSRVGEDYRELATVEKYFPFFFLFLFRLWSRVFSLLSFFLAFLVFCFLFLSVFSIKVSLKTISLSQ